MSENNLECVERFSLGSGQEPNQLHDDVVASPSYEFDKFVLITFNAIGYH